MILKQWEYKIVSGPLSVKELNTFGLAEWELCAVLGTPLTYFFKRGRA